MLPRRPSAAIIRGLAQHAAVPYDGFPQNMKRRFAWIIDSAHLDTSKPEAQSTFASVRYRAILPVRELVARGHAAELVPLSDETLGKLIGRAGEFDAVVLWKNLEIADLNERVAWEARRRGVRVCYDVCDDLFRDPTWGEHFARMIRESDRIVASSEALADLVRTLTQRESAVIKEPYEGPRGEPRWEPAPGHLKLLWFGHPSNLYTLKAIVPELYELSRVRPLRLEVVTLASPELVRQFKTHNQAHRHRLALHCTEWSPAATWKAVQECDLVIIPSDPARQAKLVKSPNRIIESLWAGRFVVAHPIPSYVEFGEWAWLGSSIAEGLTWACGHGEAIIPRIAAAQAHIEQRYSPQAIADQWMAVLNAT